MAGFSVADSQHHLTRFLSPLSLAAIGIASALWLAPTSVTAQQAYNPYRGAMQTQAAPRMAVATSASNQMPVGQMIQGIAEVTSAGVVRVNGVDLRLHGIIVPLEASAQSRASGDMIRMTKGNPVECVTVGTDTDGMTLAACGTDIQPNLALALIDAGRALVDRQQVANTPVADLYLDAERQARRADLGLWGPETGPIPVHTAGTPRRMAPTNLAPPPPKPMDQFAANQQQGPVIRFDDGSYIDLSNPISVPAPLPGTTSAPNSTLQSSFVAPDMPASLTATNSGQGIGQESFDQVSFNTLGLRDLPDQTMQLASLENALALPAELPAFGDAPETTMPSGGNDSVLLGLIGHLDDVIQRHRNAREQGELYVPTPPGEEPQTIPHNFPEEMADSTMMDTNQGGFAWWRVVVFMVVGSLAMAGAFWVFRWHQGFWPWERPMSGSQNAWQDRKRSARNLAATLDQEALNLSFALAERADIARLASSKPSGHTASDLRALRIEMPKLIGDNWEEVGRFSRSIGLQARMLHTQLAEYDRRVADLAALATEGRLHENIVDVFAALAKRLDELATLSKSVHQATRQRLKTPPAKTRKPRAQHQRGDVMTLQSPNHRSLTSPQWAEAARA